MKTFKLLAGCALACAAAAAMSGCSTVNSGDLANTVSALAAAGCSGTIEDTLTAQTAAGVSPGSASLSHKFTGTCDPSKAVKATVAVGATVGAAAPVSTTP